MNAINRLRTFSAYAAAICGGIGFALLASSGKRVIIIDQVTKQLQLNDPFAPFVLLIIAAALLGPLLFMRKQGS